MSASCYIYQLYPSACFNSDFKVTSTIEEDLDGSPFNVVLWPFGWISMILFGVSSILFYIFQKLLGGKVKMCK